MIDSRRFQNKYRTTSSRLKGYDYSKECAYFVTICTKDKLHYFGEIIFDTDNPLVNLSPIGLIAAQHWFKITEFYPFVILDQFIVMPNHLHGILIISNSLESNLINSERHSEL